MSEEKTQEQILAELKKLNEPKPRNQALMLIELIFWIVVMAMILGVVF